MANEQIRKAGEKIKYTDAQKEVLKKCANNPFFFIENFCKVIGPDGREIYFNLFNYQERLIDAVQDCDRVIALWPRQSGKCLTGNTLITHNNDQTEIENLFWFRFSKKDKIISFLEKIKLKLATKPFTKLGIKTIEKFLWCLDSDYRSNEQIDTDNTKKFTHQIDINFQSDFGKATKAFRTVPYRAYLLKTKSHELVAADKHLVSTHHSGLQWIEDLHEGQLLDTESGPEPVLEVTDLKVSTHMYDIQLDTEDHLYYSNGILSHNTEAVVSYMLWFAMFHPNRNVLIAAHKWDHVAEIMKRVKQVYENLPRWIKAGVTPNGYNARSVGFENGSYIMGDTTTSNTGRGKSINLLYVDEFAFVPPKLSKEFWASIQPTLSATNGKCIITSTPSSDDDEFAQLWHGATNTTNEHGEERQDGIGRNGFKAIPAWWWERPGRDDTWKQRQIAEIGQERWEREFECLQKDTIVTVKDQNDQCYNVTIGELHDLLKRE